MYHPEHFYYRILKMSVLKFAEEFTHLIIRFTKTYSLNINPSNAITPLTNKQIESTVHQVLLALSIKSSNDDNNLLEVMNNTNAVNIREIPIDNKVKPNIENTCSSQDVPDDNSFVSDISLESNKKENSFNALHNEEKIISQSSPMICINSINRSDTFVREDNQKINEEQDDIFEDLITFEIDDLSNQILQTLNEMQKFIMDIYTLLRAENIVPKLNNIDQTIKLFEQWRQVYKKLMTNNQQLLLINGHSSPHRTSTTNKVKTPTKLNFPANTLTFPKLFITEDTSNRRKSTGGIKTNTPKKSCESKIASSKSNLNLCNIKSSSFSSAPLLSTTTKFMKNPKYAHVQSTVSKIINQKKKPNNCNQEKNNHI